LVEEGRQARLETTSPVVEEGRSACACVGWGANTSERLETTAAVEEAAGPASKPGPRWWRSDVSRWLRSER